MKTFEEALTAALRIGEVDEVVNPEESDRVLRLQGEYMEEIHASPVVDAAAAAFIVAFERLAQATEGLTVESAMKNAYKNGLMLGLTVGIQMERQDELPEETPQGQQSQSATREIQPRIV